MRVERSSCTIRERDAPIWELAKPYLDVRSNDAHTLYAYGLAQALLPYVPEADPDVVLPAILLHDIGWKTVPADLVLAAIRPGSGRPDLVRQHETEGARIARDILMRVADERIDIERVTAIVDGHDTRLWSLGPSDSVVKDADKVWRITPHGLATIGGWFELSPRETLRLVQSRVTSYLFNPASRALADGLGALALAALSAELASLEHVPAVERV